MTAHAHGKRAWTDFKLPPVMSEHFRRLHKRIDVRDVVEFEKDVHVTVKWGTDPKVEAWSIRARLGPRRKALVQFGPVTIFENDDRDVLVVTLKSRDLQSMNRLLSAIPNTVTTHPGYTPHVTLAYLRKGRGQKYQDFDIGIQSNRHFLLGNLQYNQPIPNQRTRRIYIGD